MSSAGFDRAQLLDALDEIGRAAVAAGARLDIAVFGGSALMLAGNFRFSTEDADIAEIEQPWPTWLSETGTHRRAQRLVPILAERGCHLPPEPTGGAGP